MSEIKFFVKLAPFMNKNCKIFGNDTLFGNHRMLEYIKIFGNGILFGNPKMLAMVKYLAMTYLLAITECWQW